MQVKELSESDITRWDSFVEGHPEGTFFHRAAWRQVIETALGHNCHYFYVERAGEILGVLPLSHVKSRLFGNVLSSLVGCVYGGPLVLDSTALSLLNGRAQALAEELRVDFIEYRCRAAKNPDWVAKHEAYATFRRPIDPDHEVNMKAIPRKQRAMVRKGISNGLVSEVDETPDRHFALYAESVRNLGSPVLSKRYFECLRTMFREACDIVTISRDGMPLASVMNFYFRDEVLPYYGGGSAAARGGAANDFMYWEVMRRAAERGYRVFDFGRSKVGTGAYAFKKHWGFEPQPLAYEYRLIHGHAVPDLSPLNPKFRLMIAAWKRMPLGVTNFLGPYLARYLV